jgi:hypothetical protein
VGLNLQVETITRATRDPQFRVRVLTVYGYTCAVCGFDVRLGETALGVEAQGFQHVWRRCHPQSLCGRTTILPPSTGYENDGHGSTFWQLVQQ